MNSCNKALRIKTNGAVGKDPKSSPSKLRKRGNLQDFYDKNVDSLLKEKDRSFSCNSNRSKNKLSLGDKLLESSKVKAVISGGNLVVDNRLLTDECAKEFNDNWFFNSSSKMAKTQFNESYELFEVPDEMVDRKMDRPLTSIRKVTSRDHFSSTKSSVNLLNQNEGIDDFSKSFYRSHATNGYSTTELTAVSSDRNIATLTMPQLENEKGLAHHKKSNQNSVVQFEETESELIDGINVKTMKIIVSERMKAKYQERAHILEMDSLHIMETMKANADLPNRHGITEISANDILFLECLRKHVLPYPLKSLQSAIKQGIVASNQTASTSLHAIENGSKLTQCSATNKVSRRSDDKDDEDSISSEMLLNPVGSLNRRSNSKDTPFELNSTTLVSVTPSSIVHLNLTERGIGNERAMSLCQGLLYCPLLQSIQMGNNRLNDHACSFLIDTLFKNTQVTNIDLSDNSIGAESIASLAGNLIRPKCNLLFLLLNRCDISDSLGAELALAMTSNKSLRKLEISGNKLGNEGDRFALQWAELLCLNETLVDVDFSTNYFRRNAMQALLCALKSNSCIARLNLASNQASDTEICSAAMSIESNSRLTDLDLSNNRIGTKGCIALSFCCSRPTCAITYLNLLANPIGEVGCQFTSKMMKNVAILSAESSTSRSFHIACETMHNSASEVQINPFNITGCYELDMTDPYDHILARVILKEVEDSPFSEIRELKWYNQDFRVFEYPSLKRIESNNASAADSGGLRGGDYFSTMTTKIESIFAIKLSEKVVNRLKAKRVDFRECRSCEQYKDMISILADAMYECLPSSYGISHELPILDSNNIIIDSIHFNAVSIAASERMDRWLSESDLYSAFTFLDRSAFAKMITLRLVQYMLPNKALPLVGKSSNLGNHGIWTVPMSGILHVDVSIPVITGMAASTFTRDAFEGFLESFKHIPKTGFHSLTSFTEGLLESKECILALSCDQAELLLKMIANKKSAHYYQLVEKLLFQISSPHDVTLFITRNLHFHEILFLKKKLNFLFKVLTGNVTGHYYLNLADDNHRLTALRLAAHANYEKRLYPDNSNKGLPSKHDGSLQSINHEPFRNSFYNNKSFLLTTDWLQSSPSIGRLRFDYVSPSCIARVFPVSTLSIVEESSQQGSAEVANLRKEKFIDTLIHQIFTKDLIKKSRKLFRRSNIPPKNHSTRSSSTAAVSTVPSEDIAMKLSKVLNLLDGDKQGEDEEENLEDGDNSSEEDDEDSDDDYSDEDMSQSPKRLHSRRDGVRLKRKKRSKNSERSIPLTLKQLQQQGQRQKGISKHSLYKMKDSSANDDTGARSAFLKTSNSIHSSANLDSSSISIDLQMIERGESNTNKEISFSSARKSLSIYERRYQADVASLWRDVYESTWQNCLLSQKRFLQRKALEIFRDTAPKRMLDQQVSIPEEIYFTPTFQDFNSLPSYSFLESIRQSDTTGKSDEIGSLVRRPSSPLKLHVTNPNRRATSPPSSPTPSSPGAGTTPPGNTSSRKLLTGESTSEIGKDVVDILKLISFESCLLVLEVFILYNVWLDSSQIKQLLLAFKQNGATSLVLIHVISLLWSRVTDKQNLKEILVNCLDEKAIEEFIHRFGILNILSSSHVAGKYTFDLAAEDNQIAMKLLLTLLSVDKSIEMINVEYRPSLLQDPIVEWTSTHLDSLPKYKYGKISFTIKQMRPPSSAELKWRKDTLEFSAPLNITL